VPTKSKPEMEARKLELEISELERHWWQKPAYVAVFIPILVAVITLGQFLYTDSFKNQRTLLEIQSIELEKQKKEIKAQIESEQEKLAEANQKLRQLKSDSANAGEKYKRDLVAAQETHAKLLVAIRGSGLTIDIMLGSVFGQGQDGLQL
jgi:predicted metal-dependent hydrolase